MMARDTTDHDRAFDAAIGRGFDEGRRATQGHAEASRMLCTECLYLGTPDTRVPGSDRVELVAWALLLVPGLLVCAWRHLAREKACAECDSRALMRESRASVLRLGQQAVATTGPRVESLRGRPFDWPAALRTPRERLRSGSRAAVAAAFGCSAAALGALDLAPSPHVLQTVAGGWLLGGIALAHQVAQAARSASDLKGCEAWDESGRRLRVERV